MKFKYKAYNVMGYKNYKTTKKNSNTKYTKMCGYIVV